MTELSDDKLAEMDNLQALQIRIQEIERERNQFLELLQRTRADFENYQKRSQRDLQQERRYCAGPLALELLPALDNLERAITAAQQARDQSSLVQGVCMVYEQLLDVLRRHSITQTNALHQPFDPNQHQAVMQQSSEQPPNSVLQVLQQGFMIHDRVLRPASVVVAVPPQ